MKNKWIHSKKTHEEINTFRLIADKNDTQVLEGLLFDNEQCDSAVPEFIEVLKEIVAQRHKAGKDKSIVKLD